MAKNKKKSTAKRINVMMYGDPVMRKAFREKALREIKEFHADKAKANKTKEAGNQG